MERPQLDHEIEIIHNDLLEMGALVEDAILDATKSLKQKDTELALKVIKNDNRIDDMEQLIEERCIKILATQGPMAGDLRNVLAIMKLITDLERIGDHCENIANYTIKLAEEPYIKQLIDIPKMAELASQMVHEAIDVFIRKDAVEARLVWKKDYEIDGLAELIRKDLLALMVSDNEKVRQGVQFMFIAAHYERIGDYAKNICEKAAFISEGICTMKKLDD